MPEVDGLEVARVLWEENGIPSIIVSAFSDKKYIEEAQANGVFGYMLKPVSTDNLRVTISIAWARALSSEEQTKRIDQLETTLTHRRIVEQAQVEAHRSPRLDRGRGPHPPAARGPQQPPEN